VDEAAEQVETTHLKSVRRRLRSKRSASGRVGRFEIEGAVRPASVVVADIYSIVSTKGSTWG
jgi:hypothetical protein